MNNYEELRRMLENVNTKPIDNIVKTSTSFIYDNGTQSFGTKHVHMTFENNTGDGLCKINGLTISAVRQNEHSKMPETHFCDKKN